MTDPTDNLIRQLAAADPVDHRAIPSADDPAAQQLLENIVNDNLSNRSSAVPIGQPAHSVDAGATGDAAVANGLPPSVAELPVYDDVENGVRRLPAAGRSLTRGRGMLLGAAAAVLLLVGGLLVFSPDSTPSAVAAVHSAAAAVDADTGRIATTFSLTAQGDVPTDHLDGRFEAAYAGSNVAVSIEVDQQPDVFGVDDLPVSDARLVDDVLYVDNGGQWLAIDTDGLLGGLVADFIDPRVVLETVQGLTETTEIGPATIEGVATTHYRSVVDLGDESLSQSGWLAFEGLPIQAEGVVTVDLYVDSDGLLNRLDLSGDVRNPDNSAESGTFEVSMKFFDIGADITIEAPADAEAVGPLDGLFGE